MIMIYSVPSKTPSDLLGALDLVCAMTPHIQFYGASIVIHNVGVFFVADYNEGWA
jgi:hypothetical protein